MSLTPCFPPFLSSKSHLCLSSVCLLFFRLASSCDRSLSVFSSDEQDLPLVDPGACLVCRVRRIQAMQPGNFNTKTALMCWLREAVKQRVNMERQATEGVHS